MGQHFGTYCPPDHVGKEPHRVRRICNDGDQDLDRCCIRCDIAWGRISRP